MLKILFVCARNQWRSPTAEQIFSERPDLEVRSAGLSPKSPRRLSQKDIEWADIIMVMEQEHKIRILEKFQDNNENVPPLYVLNIPDNYQFMDPELVSILLVEVEGIISRHYDER